MLYQSTGQICTRRRTHPFTDSSDPDSSSLASPARRPASTGIVGGGGSLLAGSLSLKAAKPHCLRCLDGGRRSRCRVSLRSALRAGCGFCLLDCSRRPGPVLGMQRSERSCAMSRGGTRLLRTFRPLSRAVEQACPTRMAPAAAHRVTCRTGRALRRRDRCGWACSQVGERRGTGGGEGASVSEFVGRT